MESPDHARWFSQHVQPHEPALRAFLQSRFGSLSELDDLVQESFARVLQAHAESHVTNVKSYLFSTARNLALDHCRRRQVVPFESIEVSPSRFVSDTSQDTTEHVCHEEELQLLRAALDTLPARCREVLALRKLHGLSREEIAERMGISPHTVNAQIALGMLRCRRYFQAHGLISGAESDDATAL